MIIFTILIAVGLAMDAFAVAICKGLAIKEIDIKKSIIIGLYFGIFQAGMPLIGYLLGSSFSSLVDKFDHWIAFILLLFIGINMIKESKENDTKNSSIDFKTMILLAIATSIDALTVGITFAFFNLNIIFTIIMIGIITFILSIIGVIIGHEFGDKFKNKAEIFGGIILIIIGIKILVEHLGII